MADARSGGEQILMPRMETGIAGFEHISHGGLPEGSVSVLTGPAGSGKTVFALQFLAEGVRRYRQAGVFVAFGETPDKLRRFVREFGWDVPGWEAEGRWAFVDATVGAEGSTHVVGENVDLTVLLDRITAAVERTGATRVALDSLRFLFARFGRTEAVREGLIRISAGMERLGVTAVMTIGHDDADVPGTFGVEEYVADNVIVLRNGLAEEARRRTIEVLKFRGTRHRTGEFPFAITGEHGFVAIPLAVELSQPSGTGRITSGIPALDEMCGGGPFQDSMTLVSGSTGTGKTSLALQFALAGAQRGEPAVFVCFEESRDQLLRGAAGWGYDIPALEATGALRFLVDYPEIRTLEEHLVRIQAAVAEIGATRLALDNLSVLRRVAPERAFLEFATGLTADLKQREVAGLLTTAQTTLFGPDTSPTAEHVSALVDAVILLRYVEVYGELKKGIAVLKMRGSNHQKDIRELTLGAEGIRIGPPLRTTTGIMSGRPTQLAASEAARFRASADAPETD
jgi:circadian clock protein KaiC